jgi:hypothetical protein
MACFLTNLLTHFYFTDLAIWFRGERASGPSRRLKSMDFPPISAAPE